MIRRTLTSATMLLGLALSAGACGGGDDGPKPLPPAPSTSSAPTPTEPAWHSDYSPDQVSAFDTALRRYTDYERDAEPLWAAGKYTPEAETVFKRYWSAWENPAGRLRNYESVEVKISGTAKVLWSKPRKLEKTRIIIRQCYDTATRTATIEGEPRPTESHRFLREVSLYKAGDGQWWIDGERSADTGWKKPC